MTLKKNVFKYKKKDKKYFIDLYSLIILYIIVQSLKNCFWYSCGSAEIFLASSSK